MRRVLGPAAAAWLFSQLASVVLLPLVVTASNGSGFTVSTCTCRHGTDAACPMHRSTAPGFETCTLRSSGDPATFLLASLFGFTGPALERTQVHAPVGAGTVASDVRDVTIRQPGSPDPPPPRG